MALSLDAYHLFSLSSTGLRDRTPSPISPSGVSERSHHRKERVTSSRYRKLSHHSQINPFNVTPNDLPGVLDPAEALSQLQIQNQRQLNALLNLKILASLKAAVSAQNVSSTPLLGGFLNLPTNQSPTNHYYTSRYGTVSPGRPSSSNTAPSSRVSSNESQVMAKYLSQLQALGKSPPVLKSPRQPQEFSDSDDDNYTPGGYWNWGNKNSTLRHPSDPCSSTHRSQRRCSSPLSRLRSFSLSGEKLSFADEDVDTEELTRQVKELLQANNIGQRAFGQYVLGLSQGSVSEILSKPKSWSKLTFKGKEPFYKMMDFVSERKNVDILKSLQRRDREERVLCGSRNIPLRNSHPESEQAIANILAAAREEMKAEQEKLKRAEDTYSCKREKEQREHLSSEHSVENFEKSSPLSTTGIMTTVATGHCTTSIGVRLGEKMTQSQSTTNGAIGTNTLGASLPPLIKRQQQRTDTGNENGRALKEGTTCKDKVSLSESNLQGKGAQSGKVGKISAVKNLNSENRGGVNCEAFASDSVNIIKTEPKEGLFDEEEASQKVSKIQQFSATKEELLSANQRLINSQNESESLRRLFVTTTYNDPFIPPPLSPSTEDAREASTRSRSKTPPGDDGDTAYESPFIGDDSSTNYINENSEHSDGNSPSERSEPVLFKELSTSNFDDSTRDNGPESSSGSVPSTFSNMLSSGMSTATSIFDAHASYTELSPVTTGSLFHAQRDSHEHELTGISSAFSSTESSQNGISSMLPPLAMSSHQHATSPAPTYSTLSNASVSSSKYTSLPEGHPHIDEHFDVDNMMENSSITTPIPPDTLQKLLTSHVDTSLLTKQVRDRLVRQGICQRTFGEKILGLSQGTVSDILSHPKLWSKLTTKGREPFVRMMIWLTDSTAGGLLPLHEGSQPTGSEHERSSSCSPSTAPVNLSKEQGSSHSSPANGAESGAHFTTLSPPTTVNAPSPHNTKSQDRISPNMMGQMTPPGTEHHVADTPFTQLESHFKGGATASPQEQPNNGTPVTPLQQMLNIQELAASCPKLDTFALTRKVKDLLTEHNIGQRIFGQAVLGLTQGSVSDLLSRPKLWRSLSLKGREPFVRMQLWLSDPNNIEQLKNLKLERWMEKKWGGKRQRNDGSMHSLSPVKKQRIVLSSEEKEVLRQAYAIEPYPSQETVDLLAVKLGRKSSTIVNWFHNYRSRVKRGFFPGEEIYDNQSKKAGGSKMTVKQLLDGITLSNPPSNNCNSSRNTLNSQRAFSSKNGHHESGSTRRSNPRVMPQITQQTWVPTHNPSPTSFDRYPEHHMKTETLDQHFQNLQRPEDIYANSVMHVKEEAKMLQLHSDVMFNPSYSYQMANTAVPDLFKSTEMSLGDPVAMAAASSFIQQKPIQDSSGHFPTTAGQLYANLDELHHQHPHDNYAAPMSNDSTFSNPGKLAVSPSSPHSNSILPPVHTLTPKKSFGSPPSGSNIVLPSASSLLNPTLTQELTQLDPALGFNPTTHQRHQTMHHRLINLSKPRYDTIITNNNNMNNNSCSDMIKNVTLPGGVSLSVTSTQRSPIGGENDSNKVTATVWVSSSSDGSNQGLQPRSSVIKTENVEPITSEEQRYHTSPANVNEKEHSDDSYAWVF